MNQRRSKEVVAFANKFYLSNKKDGRVVFHCGGDIIASFNYYPADILCDALYDISTSFERMLPLQGFYIGNNKSLYFILYPFSISFVDFFVICLIIRSIKINVVIFYEKLYSVYTTLSRYVSVLWLMITQYEKCFICI